MNLFIALIFSLSAHADFDSLREQFLSSVRDVQKQNPKAALTATPITNKTNESLPIDSVYIPALSGEAKNLIILTSGIHGVEAEAGSREERQVDVEMFEFYQ